MASKCFYRFSEPLLHGQILSRPNRFIMKVKIGESVFDAHCPVTGKIFNIDFKESKIFCLLSKYSNSKIKRKTEYTVEAISFDQEHEVETMTASLEKPDEKPEKSYIGINQTKVNRYIEYFISQNAIPFLPIDSSVNLQREVKIGQSKLDFLVGNHYLEIKTPLSLPSFKEPIPSQIAFLPTKLPTKKDPSGAGNRLLKHFLQLSDIMSLPKNDFLTQDTITTMTPTLLSHPQRKASVCLVFMYDAKIFTPPKSPDPQITDVVQTSLQNGVTYYQINLRISSSGVELMETMPLSL